MKEKMNKALFDQAWWLRGRIKNCIAAECTTGLPDWQERHGFIALIIVLMSGSYAVKICYIDEVKMNKIA